MTRVLALYSEDPSLNPAADIVEKNENKQKEIGVGPFFKNRLSTINWTQQRQNFEEF